METEGEEKKIELERWVGVDLLFKSTKNDE